MIDQLFMKDLAFDLAPPLETEQPATLLASGPATSDVGQVTVQGYDPSRDTAGGAFVGTRLNTPKAGQAQPTLQDREKLAIGLLDTLAGALRGAAIETVALPGNIRSIVDMINKEGAEKYFGQAVAPTTEDIKKAEGFTLFGQDIPVPPVLGADVPNRAERQKSVETAEEVGAYLPAPGVPEAVVQGAKLVGKAIKATKGLPVGMSTQAVGEGVDQLGFYSAAKQAVDAIQQPKGTGDQFLKQIEKTPGVKPDEIKWTGLDEFLKSKKSVTKAEVQEYLTKNRVEVKEITLNEGARPYRYVTADEWQGAINDAERVGNFDEAERITAAWEDFELGGGRNKPKFAKYTLPGGENYREVLLTLPVKPKDGTKIEQTSSGRWRVTYKDGDSSVFGTEQEARNAMGGSSSFSSQHFDQPNILAHLRVNDRVDVDGKKVLFVEEVQSDWHQAGRKKGYQGDIEPSKIAYEKAAQASHDYFKEMYVAHGVFGKDAEKLKELDKLSDGAKNLVMETLLKEMSPEETAQYEKLFNQTKDTLTTYMGAKRSAVPDAPFKTTWSELAMKRAIQMASEGGYDRIAFTTGKTQAERFDLSKQVERITAIKDGDNFKIMGIDIKGNSFDLGKKSVDELPEILGKDLADKIAKQETPNAQYAGKDLVVGGEGMKGFYDDILPKFLNKYAKKWDAKAGMTEIATEPTRGAGNMPSMYPEKVPVHYIDITPKMRESVVTKGQPMFAIGAGGAGAAATQQEDNK